MSVNSSNQNFIEDEIHRQKRHLQNQQPTQRPLSFYDNYRIAPNNLGNLSNGYAVPGVPASQPATIGATGVYNPTTAPLVKPEDETASSSEDTDTVVTDSSDKYYQLKNLSQSAQNISTAYSDTSKLNGFKQKVVVITRSNSVQHQKSQPFQDRPDQDHQQQGSPSLAYCLSTTVPQNIAAATIAGRHAPTRNSLRHSRMIVLNRSGRAEKYKRKGLLIRQQSLARTLLGLQTFLGVLLCILALWLLVWAPNIPRKDNTYWSALPLFVSGVTGLFLLGCCKQKRYKNPQHFCAQSSKLVNIFITVVAAVTCIAATIFAIHHLLTLSHMICEPRHSFNTTCTCYFVSSSSPVPATTADGDENVTMSESSNYYHYIDLSCPEVNSVLKLILTFSATTNIIAFIVTTIYLYLHWRSRYLHSYMSVRTDDTRDSIPNYT